MKNRAENNNRAGVIRLIFVKAKELGIPEDVLRKDIAPNVAGKRISKCNLVELAKLADHLKSIKGGSKTYESSFKGLKEEVVDIAQARFGDDFEEPLNNLCKKFKVTHYRWLTLRQAKAIKDTLTRLQEEGPYVAK